MTCALSGLLHRSSVIITKFSADELLYVIEFFIIIYFTFVIKTEFFYFAKAVVKMFLNPFDVVLVFCP